MGKEKTKKCAECEQFYKLKTKNMYHKTAYCNIGEKSVNVISDKSIACTKIQPIKQFKELLEK